MATFAKSLDSKLKSLDASQTGIQTLSLWIIHHRHHASTITDAWIQRVKKAAQSDKKLGLFYLANDVVQNGRKKAKDLVLAFGKAFYDVINLYCDEKTKPQVERVFNIWVERSVYDADFIAKLRLKLAEPKQASPKKATPKPQPAAAEEGKKKPAVSKPRKVVPPDFKVANLLVSIKKTTSHDNEVVRKSKKLDSVKIDTTSYDSLKHVKDRSSVGRFHKQFEESKIILDDYIHTLRRSERDKKHLMTLLSGGEAFYSIAQDEAKVIVNAYKTFGNRLNSMKRKLDLKIKKMEGDSSCDSWKADSKDNSTNIQDMDLDSSSGDELSMSEKSITSNAPTRHNNKGGLSINVSSNHSVVDSTSSQQQLHQTAITVTQPDFFNSQMNGMSSFLVGSMNESLAPLKIVGMGDTSKKAETPDGLTIVEDPFKMAINTGGLLQNTVVSSPFGMPLGDQLQNTSVMDTSSLMEITPQDHAMSSDKNPAVQNLIDSLFPVLSKSLQTIKEKTTQAVDEKPSVNAAMAFALGDPDAEEKTWKKFESDASAAISPVSLTNPKGLSEHQEELINIAAGLTEFDENFLPVTKESVVSRSQSYEEEKDDDNNKRNSSNNRYRHRSHRRSSSRSPQRRSSHRSSKDGRDERRSDKRRSTRHSPSPRRRKGSRGRLTSSKDGDESKRSKHSPDSGKNVYYNNRRSPTPEMDSSASVQFPQQNVHPTQQQNHQQQQQQQQQPLPSQQTLLSNRPQNLSGQQPLVQNQPQLLPGQQPPVISAPQPNLAQSLLPAQTAGLIPPQPSVMLNPLIQASTTPGEMTLNNKPPFAMQTGLVVNPTPGIFSSDRNNPHQDINNGLEPNDTNKQENPTLTPLPQVSSNFQQQTPLTPINHLHTIPPQMNFDSNIRSPLHAMQHANNSLRLLQQQGIEEPTNPPIQLPQIASRIIRFNPPRFVPMSNRSNLPNPHEGPNPNNRGSNQEGGLDNFNNNDNDLSQNKNNSEPRGQLPLDNSHIQTRPRLVTPRFDVNNPPPFPGSPPPFPGAPPVPPPFMSPSFPPPNDQGPFNPPEVRPRFISMDNPREIRPRLDGGDIRPTFIPENIRSCNPSIDLHGGIRHRFNQPNFEPSHNYEMQSRFRPPRFGHGVSGGFRPRTRYMRPRLSF